MNNNNSDTRTEGTWGMSSNEAANIQPQVSDARAGLARTSTAEAFRDAARSAGVPWERAINPRNGSPLAPHEVNGDSIIRMQGRPEVTLDQARQLGWVKDGSAHRSPFEATQAQQSAPQEQTAQQDQQQPEASAHGESIGPDGEGTLGLIYSHTSAADHLKAIEQIAEHGEIAENTLGQLASQLGGQPSQVSAMVEKVRPAFEAQANRAVEAVAGIDPQDVWDWAWTNKPKQIQGAISSHLTQRNTEAYKALARDYVANLDTISPDAILGAEVNGGQIHRDHAGRIVITGSDGRTYSWAGAVNAGWIKLARRS